MKILRGTEVSTKIKGQMTQVMGDLGGPAPKLAVIRVGEEPDDMSYERGTVKRMENFGPRVQTYTFPEQVSDSDFRVKFSAINRDPDVSGTLLLRPLSKRIAETDIRRMIDPEKDLDGISPADTAKVFVEDKAGLAPRTAEMIMEVLEVNEIDVTGKNITIVGHSMVIDHPLSMLMLKEDATITIYHTRTRDLETECRGTEILVAAVGKTKMLDSHHVGRDAIVIDVGISVDENRKLCGDVDFPSIEPLAPMATPMPGGAGAVTAAVLARHLVLAGRRQGGS